MMLSRQESHQRPVPQGLLPLAGCSPAGLSSTYEVRNVLWSSVGYQRPFGDDVFQAVGSM